MEDEFYIDLPMPIISLNVFQLFYSCRNSEYETAKRGLIFKGEGGMQTTRKQCRLPIIIWTLGLVILRTRWLYISCR